MNFNLDAFAKKIHSKFSGKCEISDVKRILTLDEDSYIRDSPTSPGKRLKLSHLIFHGNKEDGKEINYNRPLYDGVNLWMADNFTGKSSIFKIIRLALTGRDSIKQDIRKWLSSIYLEFYLGERSFTAHLDLSGARINGKVYSLPLSQILSDEEGNLENHTVFSAKSMGQYEKNLEDFFFKEFYYYAMKWTQKSSVKSSIDLLESNASWATYYKSIFLESKDYNSLFFGDQGSKILEMLLGLELTFAINRLSIRHNMLEHRMAISKFNEQQNYSEESDPSTLAEQLKLANKKIRELGPSPFDENEYSKLESKYNSFLRQKDKTRISLSQNHEELLQLEKEIFKQNLALQTEAEDLTTARKAAHTNARRINELQEYIDLGIFFSNLEVKNCPHCESKISKQRKAREKEKQRCMLCNEPFSADDLDFSQHKEKIKNLKKDSTKISNDIKEKEKTVKKVEKTMAALTQKKDGIDSSQHIEKLNEIDKELEKINNKLINHKSRAKEYTKRLELLLSDKAALDYKSSIISKNKSDHQQATSAVLEASIIKEALAELRKERLKRSNTIINNFKKLILQHLHDYGIKNITEISLTDKLTLIFTQNDTKCRFDDISEGEQLRVKLAVYLSIIELDINFNFGRHPRFIIIDSPGKEEGDIKYLDGLKSTLKKIDKRLGDSLQILVGTAERSLTGISKKTNQQIAKANEYLF